MLILKLILTHQALNSSFCISVTFLFRIGEGVSQIKWAQPTNELGTESSTSHLDSEYRLVKGYPSLKKKLCFLFKSLIYRSFPSR